ncbi:MAG TPA: ABC transporter permease [Pseudoxanthomonas sp.]|nr:ABC transporter permease [Pseudoxanthomonas sp.]
MMDTTVDPARLALRCYLLEAKYEFLRLLRTPAFALPALAFPVLFYLLFGVMLGGPRGGMASTYLLVTYGVFGIMGPALFGFGVAMAMDRELGLLRLKRAMPVPPGATLLSKTLMAMLFGAIITALLMGVALLLGGVELAPGQLATLALVNVLGVPPFCAMGLWIGTLAGGQGAAAVVNLVYLPMAFLSGLWMPLSMLPEVVARLAPMWPAYHLGQIALKAIDADAGAPLSIHLGALLGFTAVFGFLAHRRLSN